MKGNLSGFNMELTGKACGFSRGGDKPLNTSTMLSDCVYSGAVLKTIRRFIILVGQEQDSENPQYTVPYNKHRKLKGPCLKKDNDEAAAAAVASWAAKHPWRYALSMRFKMLSSWVPG